MALTYGFYNSIEGDRVYDAIQFGRIFDGIIKDGVYATYEKGMMVIASSNPSEVIIQPGRAWFNHTWSYNDANVIFEAPAPEVLLERYDALVLEINEELSSRENSFKWVTGTPSSRPERPTLTNTSTIHQYPLCFVHRYPETTMIYTRDITNMIGTSECPFATGVLEGIDLDAWINQWDDEFHNWETTKKTQFEAWMLSQETAFTTWYNAFKDQMAADVQEVEDFVDYLESVLDASTAIHLQEEIDDLKKEISSGSHITVTTINPELYGRNVTITEAGGTVFTEKFDNTGVAVFKSVPYVGNLTISSTYGTQTAERVVNTPYYARYEFAIAFWAATVNIVGDPEMSGSTVTIKDSNETVVGTVVLGSAGTGIFTATAPDTYKFILTYGGETMEVTLSVTQETTYTVDLHANRFKWEDWLEAGGVTGSYSSLDDVLADEVALRRLFTVHASVDYMADINDENEDVEKIIGTDLAAKWINLRDYALDTLYANTIIKGYMDTADKYFYGEWALMPQVPTMTSNTAPYGVASATLTYSSDHYAWHAFDKNDSTFWGAGVTTLPQTIYYEFVESITLSAFSYKAFSYDNAAKDVAIVDANGNELETFTLQNTGDEQFIKLNGTYTGGKFGLKIKTTYNSVGASAKELQFYAWQPKGNVPVMTANNAPYGTASATSTQSGYDAYKAFDKDYTNAFIGNASTNILLSYTFTNPICPKMAKFTPRPVGTMTNYFKDYEIRGSNDGFSTYDVLATGTNPQQGNEITEVLTTDKYYMALGLFVKNTYGGNVGVYELQFYGRELSVSVPNMTSNTAPYGEATANKTIYGSGYAYKAFNNDSTQAGSCMLVYNASMSDGRVHYKFTSAKKILMAVYKTFSTSDNSRVKSARIVYSDDGTTWENASEVITFSASQTIIPINISEPHLYWGIGNIINGGNTGNVFVSELQFYGLDYSEKEFEEGTTKKWLYDHGVELVTFTYDGADGASGITTNDGEAIFINNPTNELMGGVYYQLDVTDFNLYRAKVGDITTTSRNIYGSYAIGVDATTPTYIHANMDARYSFYSNTAPCPLAPNNIGFDISAINGVVYVIASGGETPARSGYVKNKFTELWLE